MAFGKLRLDLRFGGASDAGFAIEALGQGVAVLDQAEEGSEVLDVGHAVVLDVDEELTGPGTLLGEVTYRALSIEDATSIVNDRLAGFTLGSFADASGRCGDHADRSEQHDQDDADRSKKTARFVGI